MKEPITLQHNQIIRVAGFKNWNRIRISYTYEYGGQGCFDRAVTMRRQTVVWSIQSSAVISADYPGKDAAIDKEEEEIAAAVEVSNGQIVSVNGLLYVVRVTSEGYSDPVLFIPQTL